MSDRELLELAAKSVGVDGVYQQSSDDPYYGINGIATNGTTEGFWWNPLINSDNAIWLVVSLGLSVDVHRVFTGCGYHKPFVEVRGYESRRLIVTEIAEDNESSLMTATCRAITIAAAEIGRRMV